MKVSKANGTAGPGSVLILMVVLAVLFWRSFLPEFVHFSNDGPLGQQHANAARLPEAFHGTWFDNNDLGGGGGAWSVGVSALFRWLMGPVGYAKFLAPFALLIVGLGAWAFLRQLNLTRLAVVLGALAAMLNSTFFATACWGVAPQEIAIGMDFFALALIVSLTAETPLAIRLARLALAGLGVGMNVMEAADIGAIFSLFVSAFMLFSAWNQEGGTTLARLGRGVGHVALVAVFAGFIASQSVISLVSTQIQGIAGTAQDSQTKAAQWDFDTMWSLPKVETLGLFAPGLFGYKMDTPANMDPNFESLYLGGNYWGAMGRDPAWDRYFAAGSPGSAPAAQLRQTGGQNYAGVLVVLMSIWAFAQSLRRQDPLYSEVQRRFIWFWTALVVIAVLIAWGRYSVFYAMLYQLPYFSTIRSPTKFIIVFSWGIIVLFAYGIDGLSRRSAALAGAKTLPLKAQFKTWWATAASFDRKWVWGCLIAVIASLLGWLIFAGQKPAFISYLGTVGFPDSDGSPMGTLIATFAIHQAGWFVLLLAIATGLVVLISSGVLGGRRGMIGGVLLGLFLVADLGRADLPFIIHWDYKQKYDIDPANSEQSINPILNFLRDKSYEHRVANLPFGAPPEQQDAGAFENIYTIEWMQHQFPYYNIQSLDNWQRPRVGSDIATYESAIYFLGTRETFPRLVREWELTNTRYLLGPAGYIDALNSQLDPKHRFRIAQRFAIRPKAGVTQATGYDQITAVPDDNGDLAVFEFTGALPRAKLYSTWQVNTNNQSTLQTLERPDFDPAQTVLVAPPAAGVAPSATNANTGTVDFTSYFPTRIVLAATNTTPAVLLLNDKYDPTWQVTVDGRPAPLLRCNFIMRGVYLDPGSHTVVFRYYLPSGLMDVTLAAWAVAILLSGFLIVAGRSQPRGSRP